MGEIEGPWAYERQARQEGYELPAGLDESGRGPLAGPVVAAAVILPETFQADGIKDSKTLTATQREAAHERITRECVAFAIGVVDQQVIDEINILNATHLAARKALLALNPKPDVVLVDGYPMRGLPCPQKAIIDGDAKCVSIAAASILAKVMRDRLMTEYHERFPAYGFCRNKGYCTKEHLEAINLYGICEIHRRTFSPICELVNATCELPGLERD